MLAGTLSNEVWHPVILDNAVGLVASKPRSVLAFVDFAVATGCARLPQRVNWGRCSAKRLPVAIVCGQPNPSARCRKPCRGCPLLKLKFCTLFGYRRMTALFEMVFSIEDLRVALASRSPEAAALRV